MRCQMKPLTARLAEARCSTDESRPRSIPTAAFAEPVSSQMRMQIVWLSGFVPGMNASRSILGTSESATAACAHGMQRMQRLGGARSPTKGCEA